ncbi:hypothetical protein V6N13_074285 [Hibiscus sabdariffa]
MSIDTLPRVPILTCEYQYSALVETSLRIPYSKPSTDTRHQYRYLCLLIFQYRKIDQFDKFVRLALYPRKVEFFSELVRKSLVGAKDTLEITYEGTSDVKETKFGLLNLSYENFKMEPNENVTKMFDHFSEIVNRLKGLIEVIPKTSLSGNYSTLYPNHGIARELPSSRLKT